MGRIVDLAASGGMRKFTVRVPGGEYPVFVGAGASERLAQLGRGERAPSSLHVVSDRAVWKLHGDSIGSVLAKTGLRVTRTILRSGEAAKNLGSLERIWRDAARAGVDRRGLFLAFGGGVVGDLTGFAAGTFLRGVDFVQVPTTLLAMVDASVGGKTGANLPEGKNLVGVFLQPRAVAMDLRFLGTLPTRELRAGWAEVIKTAAIRDAPLLRRVAKMSETLDHCEPASLAPIIARSAEIKAEVVEADERESGLRMILNFGHTLGHGIEAACGYRRILHGEAVAIGMAYAARLGEATGHTSSDVRAELESIIASAGLPVRPPALDRREILRAMKRDKKRGPKGQRWVFLSRRGEAVIVDDVPPRLVTAELDRFLEES